MVNEQLTEKFQKKKLGEIANIIMGQSPESKFYNKKNMGLPLIQGNADIQDRETIVRTFTSKYPKCANKGDTIMSVRAPVGEIAKAVFDCCIGRGVCAISYFNDYIYHYMIFIEKRWASRSTGSTFDSINAKEVNNLELFLPESKEEQTIISRILSDVDELIKQLDYFITKKKNIKHGAMQELLTGKKRLEGFDGEWIEDFLGLLLLLLKDGTHNPPKRISKGIPLLASENIHDGEIDFEKSSSYISEQDYKELQKQYHISKMDLLLTIVGTIGRVSLVKQESKFSVQRSVAILRANNRISPQFLYFIIQSYTFQLQLQLNKNATAQSGIYLNSLSKIKLFFPKMVTEQEKIAEILFDMDSEIKELEAKKDKYIMIKNGMMQKLLTGEIRLT